MIYSLFFVNDSGDVFFEKHWRNIVPKSICDYFTDLLLNSPFDVPPIIKAHQFHLYNIRRSNFHLIAVCPNNTLYVFVINLLHLIYDILKEYFPNINEAIFKENLVVVYEILSEVIDGGLPATTEINVLKERIKSPNIFRIIANSVTGKSNICERISNSELTSIPWRSTGIHHVNNEAFFDVIESLNVIIDKNGSCIFSEVIGEINCFVELTGMPLLNLTFINPKIFDDISFHRSVKFIKWKNEKIVSFIPPEGDFKLLNYKISSKNVIPIPIQIKHTINYGINNWGNLDISVDSKHTLSRIEKMKLELALPNVYNCNLETTQGHFTFDSVKKVLVWDIGQMDNKKIANIHGTISCLSIMPNETDNYEDTTSTQVNVMKSCRKLNPEIKVTFVMYFFSISGVRVNKMDLIGEQYEAFKGVRYVTKTNDFRVRI